ncbi:hypothetical protein DFH09DRAFT_1473991 [Mycena vulgaris]|nr:hypothetical protein DFH09DRAFT_1473991 [Mycena vulgaris]
MPLLHRTDSDTTNGKDVEHQMSIMDENEETMARLDMKVNEWRKAQEEDDTDPILPSHTVKAHWKLGSADACMTSTLIESLNRTSSLYRDFNMHLREYLAEHYPNHPVPYEQDIQHPRVTGRLEQRNGYLTLATQFSTDANSNDSIIKIFRSIGTKEQISYAANPIFHGCQRYDSIIYEAQGDDLAMGQLELVFIAISQRRSISEVDLGSENTH